MQAVSYADARVNVNTFPFWRQSRGPNLLYSHTVKGIQQTPWEAIYFCMQKISLLIPPGTAYLGIFFFFWKHELQSLSQTVGRSMPPLPGGDYEASSVFPWSPAADSDNLLFTLFLTYSDNLVSSISGVVKPYPR